ncbi:DNA-directed RNA polymerase I subunit RPA49 [Nephila pilipes]|uniref:DNA-directed RNA polymerase I subunit RPA49 n=1 Tax=Nephila pilipes TaxID=299642 RepID=A0A8X6NE66_NEPPI|nr:DNA-directed RNA polymerase I subunit RPA49 [Nephila pilipes]
MHDPHSENDQDWCKIKIYNKRNTRVPLFVTNFSHGELNPNAKDRLRFECYKKDDSNKIGCDAERYLMASYGRLNYIGVSSAPAVQHFIGIRSKTTGKIKLYDSSLFHMKPHVKKSECDIISSTPKTYWENVNTLTESFGSKARKRALNTKLKCTADASLEESLTLNDTSRLLSPDRSLGDDSQPIIDYLPPQNRAASCAEDVFNINCIISPIEDASLTVDVQELLTASIDVLSEKKFCVYVKEHFINVSAIKAKYLLYYDYLVKFQNLKYADIRKTNPASHIPELYRQNLFTKFTVSSKSVKGKETLSCPPKMKDKIVAYIFVLALFIDDYKVNLNQVVGDLSNVGMKKLTTIAKALGCHVNSKKVEASLVNYAELKLPLFVFTPARPKKSVRK